jgi:hypothetical protein
VESGTISIPALRSPNRIVEKARVVLLQQLGLAARRKPSLNIAVILPVNRGGRGLARAPFIYLHVQSAGVEIRRAMGNHADGGGRQKQLQLRNRHAVCLAAQPIEPNEAEGQHAVRCGGRLPLRLIPETPRRSGLASPVPRVYQAENECSRSERLLTRWNFHPRYSRSSREVSCWRNPVRPAARPTTGAARNSRNSSVADSRPPGLAHEDSETVAVAVRQLLHAP